MAWMMSEDSPWDHPDLAKADRAAWDDDDWLGGIAHCMSHTADAAADGPVLDIGCGSGRLLAPMSEQFPDVEFIGLDPSAQMLSHAAQRTDARLICGSVEDVPSSLGGAYSMLVFQHLPRAIQAAYVSAVGEALKRGGVFVLQWVPEGDTGPFCHPVPVDVMVGWMSDAEMVVTVEDDSVFPTWKWACAVKT